MGKAFGLCVLILASGCVETNAVQCSSFVCPEGATCDEVNARCSTPEGTLACEGLSDGDPCTTTGVPFGACDRGLCVPQGCGDGIVSGTEQCDGDLFADDADRQCTTHGYYDQGVVTCTPGCTLDYGACTRICGDGILDPEEDCDGSELGEVTSCTQVGFYDAGDLTCTGLCLRDAGTCTRRCGDGVHDPEEICDGAAPAGESCLDYAFDAGQLGCITNACSPGTAACRRFGWQRITTFGEALTTLAVTGSTMFAGSTDGKVFAYSGGVVTENLSVLVSRDAVHELWVADADTMFATSATGTIVSRNGAAWNQPEAFSVSDQHAFWGTAANNVYVFTKSGAWRWNGSSWSTSTNAAFVQIRDAYGTGSNIWVAGQRADWALHRFDGTTWFEEKIQGVAEYHAVAGAGSDMFVAGVDTLGQTVIARRENNAWVVDEVWRLTEDATLTPEISDILVVAPDDVWAVGGRAILHFDGKAWTVDTRPTSLDSIVALDGEVITTGVLFAATSGIISAVYRYLGSTLTDLTLADQQKFVFGSQLPGNTRFSAAWAGASDNLWIARVADENGGLNPPSVLMHFDGVGWSEYGTGTSSPVTDIWGVSPSVVYAVLGGGEILRWDGTSWSFEFSAPNLLLRGVWGIGATAWAVGANRIYHRNAAGEYSVEILADVAAGLASVHGTSATNVWAVGTRGVYRFNGTAWAIVAGGPGDLNDVWVAPSGNVYAVGTNGRIMRYDGTTWTAMPTQTTVTFTSIFGHSEQDMFAVGGDSRVLHYDGTSWTPVRVEGSSLLTAVTGAGDSTVFIGGKDPTERVAQLLLRPMPW